LSRSTGSIKDATCIWLAATLLFTAACTKRKPPAAIDGAAVFEKKCATCHRPDSGSKAPLPDGLRQMSRDSILAALETGKMKWEGRWLSKAQRQDRPRFRPQ
jgi:mono/diheme cytochrome c family protein